MIFFEKLKVPTTFKIGITNLLSNITTREGSHKGGWARLLKCQLTNKGYSSKILTNKDSLHDFDIVIFDLGAEYSGALNLFGGLDEKVFNRLTEIKDYKGHFFSWKHELPNIKILESRRSNASTTKGFIDSPATFLDDVSRVLSSTTIFDHVYRTDHLLIGDSHTPSVWDPGFMIERQDGRTLYGSVRDFKVTEIVKKYGPLYTVKIHMSSIDIRHHVCRLVVPNESIYDMLTSLGNELTILRNRCLIHDVILTETSGIEDESRELPKTGFFKGTPFYGSWDDRNHVRSFFNEKIKEQSRLNDKPGIFGWSVQSFPESFFDKSGKLRFDVMEKPQSVHLSPEYYKWDLDNNKLRWTREFDIGMQTKFAALGIMKNIEEDMYGSR